LASFLKLSSAFDAIATTLTKEQKRVYTQKGENYLQHKNPLAKQKSNTSRLNGGYLPSPGVAFAEALTMSNNTR
jgi:hypothetical protein